MSYYKDKIVIITGATSGIGKAIAKKLYSENAQLFLLGRNFSSLKKELQENHRDDFCEIDLTNDSDIEEFVDRINGNCNRIDILIHSAGAVHMGSLENVSVKDLDELYAINVRAPYLLTQKFLSLIKKAKGQIVFLNSTAGLQTKEFLGQYSASKFALKAIADSLRLEVRSEGINVLSIYLGAAATPMQEKVQAFSRKAYHPENYMNADEVAERILQVIKNGKEARITDVTIKDRENFHLEGWS